jgi:hypothetical protein
MELILSIEKEKIPKHGFCTTDNSMLQIWNSVRTVPMVRKFISVEEQY